MGRLAVTGSERANFRAGLGRAAHHIRASAWTLTLLGKIDANWDLLIRTYEGPGR